MRILIIFFFGTPNFWISRSPGLQIPRFPDAAGQILRSQPDPPPNAPRDQIRRKGPCCDFHNVSSIEVARLMTSELFAAKVAHDFPAWYKRSEEGFLFILYGFSLVRIFTHRPPNTYLVAKVAQPRVAWPICQWLVGQDFRSARLPRVA